MTNERMEELREKYKDRDILVELCWGKKANLKGYLTKDDAEFLNWLCDAAYRKIQEGD